MAARDFGAAEFTLTKFMNELLVFRTTAGGCLTFRKKVSNSDGSVAYECSQCKVLGRARVVTVRDGRIVGKKNPEVDHHLNCRPIESHLITIRNMTSKMLTNVRDHHMTPRNAYDNANLSITKIAQTSEEQQRLMLSWPEFTNINLLQYNNLRPNIYCRKKIGTVLTVQAWNCANS
jgi:hypothetical protein